MILKFAIRNIRKHVFLNLIKIIGLSLSLCGIMFIALFIKNELSYDKYHPKANQIYRFTFTHPNFFNNSHFARMSHSDEIPDMANYFPEIENYVRLAPIAGGVMLHRQKYYDITEAFVCDSTFFQVFDAKLLIGDKKTVLNSPGSMVVSEGFAKKVFGESNPIGEVLSIPPGQYYGEQTDFTIAGVMKDFPQNSHFHPDLITTPATGKIGWWAWVYLQLHDNADPEKIAAGYPAFLAERKNQSLSEIQEVGHMQKLTDIHLHSDKLREIEANGNVRNLYILALGALILLVVSMSNYASLNLGMSGFNDKFIVINRVLGASRSTQFKYSLIESIIVLVAALAIALFISIPLHSIIKTNFALDLFAGKAYMVLLLVMVFFIIGLFAGIQPAFKRIIGRLSMQIAYKPNHKQSLALSKSILVVQYAFAILLIVSVLVISLQTNFVLNNSMGSDAENVICLTSVHQSVQKKFETFKTELLKYNSIQSISAMMEPPGGEANDMFEFELEGYVPLDENQNNLIGILPCDYSVADVFQLEFLSGTDFTETFTDNEGAGEYIINESALKHLKYSNSEAIIGKDFKLITNMDGIDLPAGKIIGVVKDFYLSNMKKKVNPLVLFKRKDLWLAEFVIAFKPGMQQNAISTIEQVWNNQFPEYPFNYEFVGSMYEKIYRTELLQARLLTLFTFLSVFICSMGMLGLSLLMAQQRTKEIGIRKVNGAKVSEILGMLNKEIIVWVLIALVIATPVAYYTMDKWLETYAYKIPLCWWIFVSAGFIALGIALLTVSWQSWRVATRNPVEALRYE